METTQLSVAGRARREFIVKSAKTSGLLLGVTMSGALPLGVNLSRAFAGPLGAPSSVTLWVKIGTDESITILVGSAEMGQGVATSLTQIVAEELQADWSKVRFEFAPADPAYANFVTHAQLTGGSMSIRGYYDGLRKAGAAAREMLRSAAAATWGVPTASCTVSNGIVSTTVGGNTRTLSFGALALQAAQLPVPQDPPLLPNSAFRIIGKPVTRLDLPAKTNGSAVFGIDVRVPGMVYAAIKHCPSFGGTLAHAPATPNGALAVVPLDNAVAVVVGDNTWHAIQLARSLNVAWSIPASAAGLETGQIMAAAQQLLISGTPAIAESRGNAAAAFAAATRQFSQNYDVPYLAHATMEPLCCTASVTATGCEIWAPTQAAGFVVGTAAAITGFAASQITVHTTLLGGGLGRKFEQDFVAQAIRVSKAISRPVKLTWSREEDFGHDQYRPMALARVQAGLDASGNIVAWSNRIVSPSILYQRGWIPATAVDSQAVDGAIDLPYAMPNRQVEYVRHPAAVPVGFWRSVGHSINAFVVESAIDELALLAGVDPLAYRQRLLAGDARSLNVLNKAAELAGWGTPPPSGSARGIAFAQGFGSYVAQVVEISGTASKISIRRVSCAIDCGTVVNPDTVEAQMQGGIVHGLTAAMWGRMTFANGVASPKNFNGYRMMRMRDMPKVAVSVMASGGFIGGVGEPGVPPAAPALANAYARLTGIRLRSLPLFPGAVTAGDS